MGSPDRMLTGDGGVWTSGWSVSRLTGRVGGDKGAARYRVDRGKWEGLDAGARDIRLTGGPGQRRARYRVDGFTGGQVGEAAR